MRCRPIKKIKYKNPCPEILKLQRMYRCKQQKVDNRITISIIAIFFFSVIGNVFVCPSNSLMVCFVLLIFRSNHNKIKTTFCVLLK